MKSKPAARPPRKFLRKALSCLAAMALLGCLKLGTGAQGGGGSDGSSTGGTTSSDDPCDAWKISYCKAVSKCSSFELRDECEDDIGYVICLEDAPLEDCTSAIDKALKNDSCEDLPKNCGPSVIADRTEPLQACKQIYDAICEWTFFCTVTESKEACLTRLESENSCNDYTAVLYPNLKACLDAYEVVQCGDSPPAECDHILRK